MNIIKESKDALNAVLRLKIEKSDYEGRVDTILKDYRKKARIDGFRPGMAPAGYIKKMYGKHVLLDELNKLVSENLSKYFIDEKLHLLGDPLPNFDAEKPLDLDNQVEFEFAFDIGIAPEINLKIDKSLTFPYYKIAVEEKIVEEQVSHYASRYSTMIQAEDISEKSILKGTLAQLDPSGNLFEGGIIKENATLSPSVIRDEDEKKKFLSAKKGNSVDFDIKKAFPNDTEISSMLSVSKETVETLAGSFRMTIHEINEYVPHEINEDLFKSVFGVEVKTEEAFKDKIREEITGFFDKESDYQLLTDVKDSLVDAVNPGLPETFLKRWLTTSNKKLTPEQIENEFPLFAKDLKWQLLRDIIIRDNNISVSDEEILDIAKEGILAQFRQYGLANVPDEYLEKYAQESMKKDEEKRRFSDKKYEEKVLDFIKTAVSLDVKETTREDFQKLIAGEENTGHVHDENCNHEH